MKRASWLALLALAFAAVLVRAALKGGSARGGAVVVSLVPVADAGVDTLWGMSNVFFAADTSAAGGSSAEPVEYGAVVEGDDILPVRAMRRRIGGEWSYVVDTDGDGDVADEEPLVLVADGTRRTANLTVTVQSQGISPPVTRRVPLQFIDVGEYTYARPSQAWIGTWRDDERSYTVRVRPASRNAVLGLHVTDFHVALDFDGDGRFRLRRDSSAVLSGAPREGVDLSPMLIDGSGWRVSAVSIDSLQLTLEALDATEAHAAEGFRAPPLLVRPHSRVDASIDLATASDSLTLVELWSVHCPFSEAARPVLNALRSEFAQDPVRWYSVPREIDREVVDSALSERSRSLIVGYVDSATWGAYNPRTVTPTYYLLGPDGRVLLHEFGSGGAPLLRHAIRMALGKHRSRS